MIIKTPGLSGRANMQFDLEMFNDLERGSIPSTLRIYSWSQRCISLGYSQMIDHEIDVNKAADKGWEAVKRPTGGGIGFPNEAEVTCSLVMAMDDPQLPEGLIPSYKAISMVIVKALSKFGIQAEIAKDRIKTRKNAALCFSYPAEYEVVAGERKLVGSAQKRGKRALLQQGSIFVQATTEEAFSVLKKPYDTLNAVSLEELLARPINFNELGDALIDGFQKAFKL